ncbi:winged helix-turn-helix domain-containing protein [Micromonospora sp. WMMD708]|uniref:winged helix-turn-helix domain-containing protein n=1 Tax=Micromonospora sp. WMMD708 TaxID=3403464 RepID=UPI003BF5A6AC
MPPQTRRWRRTFGRSFLSGQLKPGDKLPSFAALCERYEVSNTVIRAAMLILKAEGLIDGRQGKGVYVATPLPR